MNTSAHPAAASSTLLLQEPIELDDDSLPGIAANPRAPAASCDESAPARRPGDPYRQLYRVLHDLRTVVTQRDREREAMRRLQRESIARLALAAARGRREALEHGLRVGATAALIGHALGTSVRDEIRRRKKA